MLETKKINDILVVRLKDTQRLNAMITEPVKVSLLDFFSKPNTNLVFDLQGITFIDSSGFDVLGRITDLAVSSGSTFSLCNISDDVQELILLMEMEGKFRYCTLKDNAEKILMELD